MCEQATQPVGNLVEEYNPPLSHTFKIETTVNIRTNIM